MLMERILGPPTLRHDDIFGYIIQAIKDILELGQNKGLDDSILINKNCSKTQVDIYNWKNADLQYLVQIS